MRCPFKTFLSGNCQTTIFCLLPAGLNGEGFGADARQTAEGQLAFKKAVLQQKENVFWPVAGAFRSKE